MTATTITDPVGISEIAERLNVQRQTVNSWRSSGKEDRERSTPLPQPAVIITKTPIWEWETIRAWALSTGRLQGDEVPTAQGAI